MTKQPDSSGQQSAINPAPQAEEPSTSAPASTSASQQKADVAAGKDAVTNAKEETPGATATQIIPPATATPVAGHRPKRVPARKQRSKPPLEVAKSVDAAKLAVAQSPAGKPLAESIEPPRISQSPASIAPAPAPVSTSPPDAAPASGNRFGKLMEEQLVREMPQMPALEPEPEQPKEESAPPPATVTQPRVAPMYVVMITPELAPVAKVGGLGDVTFGLSRELEIRGNSVEIILPKYDCMRYNHVWGLTRAYENLHVPWFGGVINCTVWFGFVHGRKCFFIEPHSNENFFNRGVFYGHSDDVMRFAFFNRAALEFMLKTGKHPEVIHCHDWQTALVPVLLYEMYQHLGMRHSRVCFTIHNFRHQGVTGPQVLAATGLNRPEYYFHYDRLRDNHNPQALNLMKGGIVYSNFVTTVSPRHAWEAKDGGQGFGLEPTLHTHQGKYGGVLNGLDYDMFNPESDPHIPSHFNPRTIEKKYENKRALRQRLWLADNEKPIISFIGRLDPQKGPELVRHAIFDSLNNRAQFVLLGNSPEKGINDHFWGLKHHLNDSPDCHLEIGYNEELAHLIYAGSDMMIVPSRYEPCGLTQLIAMRYGTVPIVRSVGGLADTVFDKDHSNRALHDRNGYVFEHADNAGIESGLHRAISCYYQFPEHFRNLILNGMNCDYSWNHPGQHYLNIYDLIRDK